VIFRVTDGVSDRQISLLRGKSSLTANGRAQTPYSQLDGRSALSYTIIIQNSLYFPGSNLQKNKNKSQHAVEVAPFWATNVLKGCGGRLSQNHDPKLRHRSAYVDAFRWHKGRAVDLEQSGNEGLRASARCGQSWAPLPLCLGHNK
jgi:hypothetical protein